MRFKWQTGATVFSRIYVIHMILFVFGKYIYDCVTYWRGYTMLYRMYTVGLNVLSAKWAWKWIWSGIIMRAIKFKTNKDGINSPFFTSLNVLSGSGACGDCWAFDDVGCCFSKSMAEMLCWSIGLSVLYLVNISCLFVDEMQSSFVLLELTFCGDVLLCFTTR